MAVDHDLADDTAALFAAMEATSAEFGAEAWDGQRLVVIIPPMPLDKSSEPSDVG